MSSIRSRESLFIVFFSVLLTAIGVFSVIYMQISRESLQITADQVRERSFEQIDRTQDQLDRITGGTRPNSARVFSSSVISPDAVAMQLQILPELIGGVSFYRLTGRVTVFAETSGPPGRYLGPLIAIDGQLVDIFVSSDDQLLSDTESLLVTSPVFHPEDQNGFPVVDSAPFQIKYILQSPLFSSCEEVMERYRTIISLGTSNSIVGEISVMPVFSDIGEQGAQERTFSIFVTPSRILPTCSS